MGLTLEIRGFMEGASERVAVKADENPLWPQLEEHGAEYVPHLARSWQTEGTCLNHNLSGRPGAGSPCRVINWSQRSV